MMQDVYMVPRDQFEHNLRYLQLKESHFSLNKAFYAEVKTCLQEKINANQNECPSESSMARGFRRLFT